MSNPQKRPITRPSNALKYRWFPSTRFTSQQSQLQLLFETESLKYVISIFSAFVNHQPEVQNRPFKVLHRSDNYAMLQSPKDFFTR